MVQDREGNLADGRRTPRLVARRDKAEAISDPLTHVRPPAHGYAQPGAGDRPPSASSTMFAWVMLRGGLQFVLAAAILAGAFAAARLIVASAPERPDRPAREQIFTVDMVTARPQTISPTFTAYGTVAAIQTVELRTAIAGEVVSLSDDLRPGASVKKGDVLVQLDPFDSRAALAEARADLAEADARINEIEARIISERDALSSAEEQLVLAERDLERAQQLRTRGSGTERAVEERQTIVSQRRAAVDQRRNNLAIEEARLGQQRAAIERLQSRRDRAERALDDTRLLAPFDAIVIEENVAMGQMVSPSDRLVSLYGADALEVRFLLTDSQFGRLLDAGGVIGRDVRVKRVAGGTVRTFEATIRRVAPEATSERGGVEVFARLPAQSSGSVLRPGTFVEIDVTDRAYEDAVVLPETALYGGDHVYVVEEDRLRRRAVARAIYSGANVIIPQGIEAGERVLTTRMSDIREGLKVKEPGASTPDERDEEVEPGPAIAKPAEREGRGGARGERGPSRAGAAGRP